MTNQAKCSTADIHRAVADKVIKAMEAHGSDWTKSWAVPQGDGPLSMSTKKQYQGINWLILGMARAAAGYKSGHWATYKQWKTMGAQVRKGERGEMVILYKPILVKDRETGEEKNVKLLRTFNVFNADQVDGYEAQASASKFVDMPDTVADQFAAGAGAIVNNDDPSGAFYVPSRDFINMPKQCQFDSPEAYSAILLHELTHWTGHESRLDRNLKTGHGTKDYAAEELVAELGAAMLCGSLGISPEPRADHAKYLNNWIERLKNEPKAIFTAAAKAQQAADYCYEVQQAEVKEAA
jgi:antirestriction protein ArdC